MKENKRHFMIFGRKGEGKTTLAVKEIIGCLVKGDYVFSNIKINWFGELYLINGFDKFINKVYNLFVGKNIAKKYDKIGKYLNEKYLLEEEIRNIVFDDHGLPNISPRDLYWQIWKLEEKIKKEEKKIENVSKGLKRSYWYDKDRFHFRESLLDGLREMVKMHTEFPDRKFALIWDEGFIDLNFKNQVDKEISIFFNEARKINADIIVCSQRPVAVYPDFRALCEFFVKVEKGKFNRYKAYKIFADDKDSIPNWDIEDQEGNILADDYDAFNGKDYYPYFSTKKGVGLEKLLSI